MFDGNSNNIIIYYFSFLTSNLSTAVHVTSTTETPFHPVTCYSITCHSVYLIGKSLPPQHQIYNFIGCYHPERGVSQPIRWRGGGAHIPSITLGTAAASTVLWENLWTRPPPLQ